MLVACEYSGTVRDQFTKIGFDAWSCDLLPTESPGNHYQGNVLDFLDMDWDLLIAHPPCTDICVSGARWFKDKIYEQPRAIQFVNLLWEAPIPRIAIENPVGVMGRYIGKPTQTIQPWQFGIGEVKATCLWLKKLPKLIPTCPVKGREARIHKLPPSADRGKLRSLTYEPIAEAMAKQWGMAMLAGMIDSF